ncbi:hypothetical protein GOHSU_04_01770 [Gordonia hirsuta DSM 44140 = NBRC 16056]|uniref:Thioredoxin-like fold domain-containing protein n=1 Tax=Gordonia hirsuta DSM 44140 = NBRC 16056 TaxID=1121927 RepID=L7L8C2_9ACTN|nr:thioredoxin domain-containing protein [Gordonia hirsuta]GAC56307.1 hypothetical protein GOHSU_04_01770 [Gordonia hirsuta DSM 44140 = NBRC 16056]
MSKKTPVTRENPDYQPRATSSRSAYVLIGVGVAVIALIVGGLVWNANKEYPDVEDAVLAENAAFIVGERTAPITVDVFEDFTCPHCREFEEQSGHALSAAAQAGELRVRYHLLTFMDDQSPSDSYSSRGAGAVLCAARHDDRQVFTRLHAALFAQAPGPDSNGDLTNAQMAELAGTVGADQQTRDCIAEGALVSQAQEMGRTSQQQLYNSNKGRVATPTVLVAGEPVSGILDGDGWVATLIAGGTGK